VTPLPPSGRQVELTAGAARAVVVTTGGGLRSLEADGHPLLDGYDEQEQISSGRGQVLVPWPNRVGAGAWTWRGRDLQLPLAEPAKGNAIHGLVRWLDWEVLERSDSAAVLGAQVQPQPGWPWRTGCRTTYALRPDHLSVTIAVTNRSAEEAPAGIGMHPYWTLGTPTVDDVSVQLRAGTLLRTDGRGLPTGEEPSTGWDGPVGAAVLDTAYGGLVRDADGWARVRLSTPSRRLVVELDGAWRWVQLFTGDTVAPERRRRGLAVEPMTCPPDALRSGRDLDVLAPGQTLTATWRVRWEGA